MIIFINEDHAYLSWLSRHHAGFVLATTRKPTKRRLVLHDANCPAIKASKSHRRHLTTGRSVKICALDVEELIGWCAEEVGAEPAPCPTCRGHSAEGSEVSQIDTAVARTTRLGHDVLDYVLEIAVIYLDGGSDAYRVTVADVAQILDKTPAQLTEAFARLADVGLIRSDEDAPQWKDSAPIFPTEKALRTVPAFAELTDHELQGELAKLKSPD